MDKAFIRRLTVAIYSILMLFIVCLGFAYSNQENSKYGENFLQYEDGWTQDGVDLVFPFESKEEFDMENVLPPVYGDQLLIIKCYYEKAVVFVDDVEIFRTRDNYLFNASSNVGKKELHIPMKPEYSGKKSQSKYSVAGLFIWSRGLWSIYIHKIRFWSIHPEKAVDTDGMCGNPFVLRYL